MKFGIAVGFGILVLLALYGYSVIRFNDGMEAYALAARGHDTATYVPGAPDNATRRVLNRILSDILTRKLSNTERTTLAQEGLEALRVSEQEIDAIGSLGENVTHAMETLDDRFTLLHKNKKREFLALAQKRFDIAADIRGLSYLANHHIAEIFNRIIKDGGEVTAAHTADLNRQIPEVESDFDKRANLYRDLEKTIQQINRRREELKSVW